MARAEAFLRRDDIRDVSTRDKRRYLEGRAGMTPGEVAAALDRAAAGRGREGTTTAADGGEGRRDGGDYYDDYDDRGRGPRRRDDDRFRDRGYRRGGDPPSDAAGVGDRARCYSPKGRLTRDTPQ